MASITSLTSSSSSSAYGSQSKGISGLASGLDTDTLIDGMTIGTRTKIAKQKQSQTTLSWKTDAYRSISDKLVSIADNYTSYLSNTNLNSAGFYSRSVITASGDNSKCVSVSGKVTSGQNLTVNGIKQLAKNASLTTTDALSNNCIETGAIDFGPKDSCTLVGQSFTVKYGSDTFLVTMPLKDGGGFYTNAAEVAAGINKALGAVDIGSGKTLGSVMNVSANGEKLNFDNISSAGNALSITGGDDTLLSNLGITSGSNTIVGKSITAAGLDATAQINPDNLHKVTTFEERMLGKSVIFNYNGTSKTITFDDATKLKSDEFEGYLQDKLDSAFGNKRIEVTLDSGKLQIKTVLPSGDDDTSSVLNMSSSSLGLMGEGSVFGIANGSSNKLNLSTPLEQSGLKNMGPATLEDGTEYEVRINGKSIKITYDKDKTSLQDIISAINADTDADVKMSYQANSDSFSIISTQDGASGSVKIGVPDPDPDADPPYILNNLERLLFGVNSLSNTLNATTVDGQDAIILVDYDGEGGAGAVEISRGTNSFSLDGMNIVAKSTFGYDENGTAIAGTDAIKFDASVDTDKVISAIKTMVEEYNALVEASNTAVSEKRDRKYPPLTDEQRKDMKESEITAWEKKAKAGMLFGDSDISNLANDLRYVFMNISSDGLSLSDIGITVSSNWKDNGKITLDDGKLKTALERDPEKVKDMFTKEMDNGKLQTGGVMARMKAITDKYAATTGATKGILIQKAGNAKSPTSMLSNSLQKQIDDIDDVIETLEKKLKSERTRYQNQFTQLEVLTQKMNTQSGWLSNFGS